MKTIRRGTFETNSSSTHSITMCLKDEFDKWKNGELYYIVDSEEFVTEAQRKEILKKSVIYDRMTFDNGSYTYKGVTVDSYTKQDELCTKENLDEITDEDIEDFLENGDIDYYTIPLTYEQWDDFLEYEKYTDSYTTPSGEVVMSFGYYGNDC